MASSATMIDTLQLVYITSLSEKFGLKPSEVGGIVDDLLGTIQDELKKGSMLCLASLQGEWLLAGERHGTLPAAVQTKLERLRAAGVVNEDLRSWYNLCELDRRVLLAISDYLERRYANTLARAGLDTAEAERLVQRQFPSYSAEPPLDEADEDSPLPVEMMLRVNDFLEDWLITDPDGLENALDESSSCNALLRRKLLNGVRPGKPCILVVDDDRDSRRMLVEMLDGMGFSVVDAAGGREALFLARRLRPNAVLMDLMMPEVDGYTAARALKKDPELASIPIAAFSAFGSQANQQAAREAGMSLFLEKPASPARLQQVLHSMLQAA